MNNIRGIGLKIIASFLFSFMSALIKSFEGAFPSGQVVFARSFFALVPLLIWVMMREGLREGLAAQNVRGHFTRGLVGSIAMFCGFTSLAYLPLSDAVAIGYAAPLMSVALAAILLGEQVRIYRWSAVIVGFGGVIVMLWPHISRGDRSFSDWQAIGAALALTGAFFSAMATIQIRRLTKSERTSAIVFYFSVFASLAGLATLPLGWVMPTPLEAAKLIAAGLLGGVAQIFMTQSYRLASASVIAPFDYISMLWAVLIGYFIFSELPSLYILVGGVIVVTAGIFVIWREHQLGLERAKSRRARTPTVSSGGG